MENEPARALSDAAAAAWLWLLLACCSSCSDALETAKTTGLNSSRRCLKPLSRAGARREVSCAALLRMSTLACTPPTRVISISSKGEKASVIVIFGTRK